MKIVIEGARGILPTLGAPPATHNMDNVHLLQKNSIHHMYARPDVVNVENQEK
jgi:hypothetical protein